MINTYQYYSKKFDSLVTVSYFNGFIKSFEIEAINENKEYSEMTQIPTLETTFLKGATDFNMNVKKVDREITFEMFWDKYDYKASGKKEAQTAWNKLNKRDQQGAYDWITPYFSQIKLENKPKLHASSYLNKQRWIK